MNLSLIHIYALDKVFDYLESCGIDVLRIPDSDEDVFIISDDDGINLDEEEEVDVENIDLSVPEGVDVYKRQVHPRRKQLFLGRNCNGNIQRE